MNIIITGATGNLGRAVSETLNSLGHQLIAAQTSSSLSSPFDAHTVDLTDETSTAQFVSTVIQKYHQIDAAVLLVGGYASGSLKDTGADALRKMYRLNFETAYFVVRPLLEHMLEKQKGRIILIGARPALDIGTADFAVAYAFAKSQVLALAQLINGIGAKKHVTATVIVPSVIDTPANREAMPKANFSNWVSPKDIAETIAFVLSTPASSLRETILKMYGDA